MIRYNAEQLIRPTLDFPRRMQDLDFLYRLACSKFCESVRTMVTGLVALIDGFLTFPSVSSSTPSHLIRDHKLAPLPLEMGSGILQPSAEVKHLGVTFDSHLSMSSLIRNICRSSFFHLWRISKVRRFLDPLTTKGAFTLPLTQRYGAKRSVAPPGVTEEYVLQRKGVLSSSPRSSSRICFSRVGPFLIIRFVK
jgi:hypothetical protein